ncbi:uncharacterized protein LOC124649182 [Lolium rigidum]|uniref:uncharacterized protein LOC124649182 n=1 Tax=Lolium rigidum TaxID=89674 RepID=UPI001F5D7596|nr:uncharacterized protein LOC124649182 [Lolium rigidum]
MSALLRQGARRIGAAVLQRTQAAITSPAVAEERRRLVPRRMYSTEKLQQSHEGITHEIQQRKDELFDLIAQGQKSARTRTWHNAWLLQYLSEEVTPRPSDSYLEGVQKKRRFYSRIRNAGLLTLILAANDYRIVHSEDKKVDLVTMMKEEHGASEVENRISPDGDGEVIWKDEETMTEDKIRDANLLTS